MVGEKKPIEENNQDLQREVLKEIEEKGGAYTYGYRVSPDYGDAMKALIPPHMHESLVRWIMLGIHPGSFLSALLKNDMMGAIAGADEENKKALIQYAIFLHNYAPSGCFGSVEKFEAWQGLVL